MIDLYKVLLRSELLANTLFERYFFAFSSSILSSKNNVRWNSPRTISLQIFTFFYFSLVEARIVVVWLYIDTSISSFLMPGNSAWISLIIVIENINFWKPSVKPCRKILNLTGATICVRGNLQKNYQIRQIKANCQPLPGYYFCAFLYLFRYVS